MSRPTPRSVKRQTPPARELPRTKAGDAVSLVAILVLRLAGHLTAAGDAMAKPAGQTSARWQVLATIEDEPATVASIARALGLARQSVQRVADLLARDGLASYAENESDRRAMLLHLTARGRSALRTIQASQRQWANELGAELGEKELRAAAATLVKMMDVMDRSQE